MNRWRIRAADHVLFLSGIEPLCGFEDHSSPAGGEAGRRSSCSRLLLSELPGRQALPTVWWEAWPRRARPLKVLARGSCALAPALALALASPPFAFAPAPSLGGGGGLALTGANCGGTTSRRRRRRCWRTSPFSYGRTAASLNADAFSSWRNVGVGTSPGLEPRPFPRPCPLRNPTLLQVLPHRMDPPIM